MGSGAGRGTVMGVSSPGPPKRLMPPLAAASSLAFIGTSEAPKSTCRELIAAMPALLPTAE